jgi:hypothetical protein
MRLLKWDASGSLTMEEFPGDDLPSYAILSHTWVSFSVQYYRNSQSYMSFETLYCHMSGPALLGILPKHNHPLLQTHANEANIDDDFALTV